MTLNIEKIPHFYFTERVCEKLAVSFIFNLEEETTGSFIITNLKVYKNTKVLDMINLTSEIFENTENIHNRHISVPEREVKSTKDKIINTLRKWHNLKTLTIDDSYSHLKGYERIVKCAVKKNMSTRKVYLVYSNDDQIEKNQIIKILNECNAFKGGFKVELISLKESLRKLKELEEQL